MYNHCKICANQDVISVNCLQISPALYFYCISEIHRLQKNFKDSKLAVNFYITMVVNTLFFPVGGKD